MKVRVFCIHFCGMKRGSDVYKKIAPKGNSSENGKKGLYRSWCFSF